MNFFILEAMENMKINKLSNSVRVCDCATNWNQQIWPRKQTKSAEGEIDQRRNGVQDGMQ